MYHVIGTGVTAILLYIISYIFYRIGYFSCNFHKKFWNILLTAAFALTAAAGIFMALQVTYKWDVPFVKTILKWHVEFGIAMVFTGLFHIIWHLSYYLAIFSKQAVSDGYGEFQVIKASRMRLNLFVTGLVSSSVQLLLLREMLNIAGGYELITGIFLGSWLIGSSAGAVLAGSSKLTNLRKINLIFSLGPLMPLSMMLFLSRMFLSTGESPSFLVSLIYTLLVLFPYCLISGFTFVRLLLAARSGNNFPPGKSFSAETLGGVAAGLLISFLTAGILDTYQLLLLTILFSLSYVLVSFYLVSRGYILSVKILTAILAAVLILSSPDVLFRQILLPGLDVKDSEDTPYGNITHGEYNGEQNTYYNQRLLAYNYDVIEREENIHYAMLQRNNLRRVILISGPLGGQLREIAKYDAGEVVYIERDPALTRAFTASPDTFNFRLSVINSDAFRYMRHSPGKAEVIILSVPPPSTLQLNRYYTTEFFSSVKNKLTDGGVFMCSPGPANDYFNKESVRLYSSVYNSLSSVFSFVKPVVGNKLYFLASGKELSVDFCRLDSLKKINNLYVSSDFLSDDLTEKKSDDFSALMDRRIGQNRLSHPVASYHFQLYNFSRDKGEKTPAVLSLILIFAAPLLLTGRRNMLMYFSASALAGFEIVMLLSLQIMIGNMYQLAGLVIAALMAGLAFGSGSSFRLADRLSPIATGILLAILYAAAGSLYNMFTGLNHEIPALAFILLSAFLPAFFTGRLFSGLTSGAQLSSPSSVYSADLAGSALGFILITGVSIPVFGIRSSVYILSGLIFTGLLFGSVKNKL